MASGRSVFLGLALLSSLVARNAQSAEPTAEEKKTARAMMDEGHTRRAAGDHVGALERFRAADDIMHVPTTSFETASEQAFLGQLVEARDTLLRVMRTPARLDEPEVFRAARKSAEALDDALSKRIPTLRIAVRGAPNDGPAQVTVDGLLVPLAVLVDPLKVNPGHHVVTAAIEGVSARAEVDVAEAETAPVTVTFPRPPSSDAVPAAVLAAAAPNEAPRAPGEATGSPPIVRVFRWGGFGIAIIGIGVGSATGAMSISTTNAVSKTCAMGSCPPSASRDLDSAHTTATISTVSFAAAGVGVVLAIVSYLIADSHARSSPAASARARIAPWIGTDGAGVTGAF